MLAEMNKAVLERCEDNYLNEPEPKKEPMRCEECGEIPYNDTLYNYDDDWLCEDCVLGKLPEIDVWDY